jgi:DNA polymerase III sliding clamp (beta) subunit (PCNA family)
MNIKVDRNLFLSELYYLQGVAAAKQVIPILSHLLIETGPGRITMRATDLDLTITTECEADVREAGSICLPARKLVEIVKSLPQAGIEIKANDLFQATITCTPSRFRLNGLLRRQLSGVAAVFGRIRRSPRRYLLALHPARHSRRRPGRFALHAHKREIVSRLLAGIYPDYSAVLPTENHNRFRVGRDLIFPAVKRVALMADDKQHAIKLEIGEGELHISSQTSEIGEAGETVPIDYAGEKITAGFNAAYLNDFFSAIEEDEILFEFKSGETQTQLSTTTAFMDRCLAVVMPVRFSAGYEGLAPGSFTFRAVVARNVNLPGARPGHPAAICLFLWQPV